MMTWKKFGAELRAKADKAGKSTRKLQAETGVDKSAVRRAWDGEPVNTENYIALCAWMGIHPAKHWSGSAHDRQER